jgi:hypothetical protein
MPQDLPPEECDQFFWRMPPAFYRPSLAFSITSRSAVQRASFPAKSMRA